MNPEYRHAIPTAERLTGNEPSEVQRKATVRRWRRHSHPPRATLLAESLIWPEIHESVTGEIVKSTGQRFTANVQRTCPVSKRTDFWNLLEFFVLHKRTEFPSKAF